MLTALTVKKHERRKGMKGLVDRLKRDRAVVQVKRAFHTEETRDLKNSKK